MPRPQRSSHRQRHGEISWLLLAWLMLGAVLALVLWQAHRQTEAHEREVLAQQAQVLRQQLQVDFRMIYLGLGRIMERLPRWQRQTDGAQELQWQLQAFEDAIVGVRAVNVLDADGTVIASSRPQLVGLRTGQREDVVRRRSASSDLLLVSAPLVGGLGRQTVILSRALRDAQGAYVGAVSASLEEDELRAGFEAVRYAPDMLASLIHADGSRFMTVSGDTAAADAGPRAGLPFRLHQDSGQADSVQRGALQPGGPLRIVALSTLGSSSGLPLDRPLVAAVGRDWQAVFAAWRSEVAVVGSAYLLTLAVGMFGTAAVRRRRRLVERQQAAVQAEAARLHQMLDQLLENVPGMIYQYRMEPDGRSSFPYATPGVREVYGLSPEEIRTDASAVLARLHPQDADQVLRSIQTSARTLGVWEDEYRVQLPGGGVRWMHGMARPQRVEGDAVLWHGYIHDVTETRQARERLDRLLQNVPGALFQVQLDRDGRSHFPYVSAGASALYDLTPEELYEDAQRLMARIHPEDLPGWMASTAVSARELSLWEREFRVQLSGRGERWIHATARPQAAGDGAVLWYGYAYDATERREVSERLERLAENVPGMIYQFRLNADGSSYFPYASAGAADVYGFTPEELRRDAAPVFARVHPEDLPGGVQSIQASAQSLQVWRREFRYLLPRLGERWLHALARPQRQPDGAVLWHGYIQDVTEAKHQQLRLEATERQLRQLAYVDGLTGVANRRHFDDQLQIEWRRCARSGQPLSLLMIDIDHFKPYNDQYGHQQGDACLRAVAGTLRTGLGRAHDLVARYGGEEFVCLLPDIDAAGALSVAESLRAAVQALQLPHASSPAAGVVTISIGAASGVPREDGTPADLLARADASLYRAKSGGRNRVALDGA